MGTNDQNLIPMSQRTKEEVRVLASNGGKKSGEVRRKRKALKEELLAILSSNDFQNKISLAIINKAVNGDVKAFEVIRDTIGEKPVEKVINIEPPVLVDDIE